MYFIIMLENSNKPLLGAIFRSKREEKGLLVRQVAAVTEMDQAIISRIETSDRLPTKEQLTKLAGLYGLDFKAVYSAWLSEKLVREYGNEPDAPQAFREAHDQIMFSMRSDVENKNVADSILSPHPSPSVKSLRKIRNKPSST